MDPWPAQRNVTAARLRALRARQVRSELQAGVLTLGQALDDPSVRGLTVGRVVMWMPSYGPQKVNELLTGVVPAIHPGRRCGELTERQRALLEEAVR